MRPIKIEYAIDRFAMEVKRQLDVLDRAPRRERISCRRRLHDRRHRGVPLVWRALSKGWQYGAAEFLTVQDYTNVQRWADTFLARPAVKRGRMVNRTSGDPSEQLRERHDASDFRDEDAGQAGWGATA